MRYALPTLSLLVLFAYAPMVSAANAEYVPLVGIPQLQDASSDNLAAYFNNIYLLTIALGALAAVVKIMIAGVKYSFTDIVPQKSEARHDIEGTLLGLGILLVPFIVLNTIYPQLTSLDILGGAVKMDLTVSTAPTQTTTPNPVAGGIDVKDQAAFTACQTQGREWNNTDKVCTDRQITDPKIACERMGGTFENNACTQTKKIITQATYFKNVHNMNAVRQAWQELCTKTTPPTNLRVIDLGESSLFQCVEK